MEENYLLSFGTLKIPCKCTLPEDGPIRRIVISVHGIGADYNNPFQKSLAEELSLFYSAVFRFCLPCHGDSTLETRAFSLRSCIDSLVAVARDALLRHPQVKELGIFGTGFGSYVTLAAMDQLQELDIPIRLVLLAPSVRMDLTLLQLCRTSAQTLWTLGEAALPIAAHLPITYSFLEELEEHFAVNTYSVPMLILHGQNDPFIRLDDVLALRSLNDQAKLVLFEQSSHLYWGVENWDMVLDLTRDWFEYGQVLLCDCQ